MQLNKIKKLFKILPFLFVSNISFGLCNFNLNSYSVFENASSTSIDTIQTLTVSRPSNTGMGNCSNAYYFFTRGNANSYNRKAYNSFGESINYNLYKYSNQNSVLKDYTDFSSSNDYITATMMNSNTDTLNQFYFNLPGVNTASVRGGVYTDNLQLNVFRGSIYSPVAFYEFSRSFPVTIVVSKLINLSLVNTGAPIDLNSTFRNVDFGTLETNEEQNFDLMISSNAGYRVSFSSLNNGSLKGINSSLNIPYTLKVQGLNINLSQSANAPVLVTTGSGVTGLSGVRIPINVKIGTVSDNHWGDYQDYVTITAATND